MGILTSAVQKAFRDYSRSKSPYELAKAMFALGDYSIRSQRNANIVYAEIDNCKKKRIAKKMRDKDNVAGTLLQMTRLVIKRREKNGDKKTCNKKTCDKKRQ